MKYSLILSVLLLLAIGAGSTGLAQVKFDVRLTVTDGAGGTQQMYFGIGPNNVFGIRFGSGVPTDSINGHSEFELPPFPPSGVFDGRFVWPRSGASPEPPTGFGQGSPNDFRPYTSPAQRDTFRIKCQLGSGTTMVVSWPAGLATRFTALTIRYFDGSGNVNTDMLTNTSVNITDAGDPAIANIYSGGLVAGVEQTSSGVPETFGLTQNYPNPFNPSTTIGFDIPSAAMTDISVFNILGQKVTTLTSKMLTPGSYLATWDGKNAIGADVASGVYFVRMSAQATNNAEFSAMRKLLLVR